MKTLRTTLVAATATFVLISGCATDDPHRRAKTGAAIGAIGGAVLGSQSSSKNGKVVGAVVGALTGAAVGNYMDKQQRELEEKLAAERRAGQITLTRIDEETLRLDVSSEVSFAINSDKLQRSFRSPLNTMANVIDDYDKTAVHVIGHTDNTGTESYNQQLSEKRASAVSRYLNRNGVDQDRMRTSGRGEIKPLSSNATSAGRSRNRRVEIYLKSFVKGRENDAWRAPI